MMIERNFSKYIVFANDSLLTTLKKISDNKSRVVFVVSELGLLEGVFADGDLRRCLMLSATLDMNQPISHMMSKNYTSALIGDDSKKITSLFNHKIKVLPLLDGNDRVVAVAIAERNYFSLCGHIVGEDLPAFLIAEVGNNHNGSFELAKTLVDEAVTAGADCVKFQMRDMDKLYRRDAQNDASADLGVEYTLDLLRRFQLSETDLFHVFDYCQFKNIIPLCTPWDLTSLDKLERFGLPGYKIASADFTNHEMLDAVAAMNKPMICSTGMSTETEIQEGVERLERVGAQYALLHCNSTYPPPFRDINLQYILHLKEISNAIVGYSGHELGINIALSAVTLGAKIIEKHFTLDKNMEGNDHKVSLLPDEFRSMVTGVRQIEEALGTVTKQPLSQGELMNRENLAKSLIAGVDIPAGTVVTESMIQVRSPGQGIQPNRKKELVGRVLPRSKKAGEFFYEKDLGLGVVEAGHYKFSRPWGVPVRYHDLLKTSAMSNMDLLEIHLSYKDMELDFKKYIPKSLTLDLVVHAPELFHGDHIIDLCSLDDDYRDRSLQEMQRVINLTRDLSHAFNTNRPQIVTNVGGFSRGGHIQSKCDDLYERLKDSLSKLQMDGVEIIPQTMPPFPWHFGGQQFHNLFVDAESIVNFCESTGMRVCLDISHSWLACNHLKQSFSRFLAQVGPFSAHMHLADARGLDGEGLQIGDGDIDWHAFWETMDAVNPTATFIPEIWQGHKDDSAGAWVALKRLEDAYASCRDKQNLTLLGEEALID
jgi:sialic acid synthase SpsE/sugar phosphate isomerase/epimerase|tara:strand:- start:101748 stop:104042 length:2295 start_codon:yes stop_codon:yes gene_type:complete